MVDSGGAGERGEHVPTLALSMIVKNAEATLRACLQSAAGLVDQIVIADTGSSDGTLEIAREFGATIVSYPWTNHFADARNASLAGTTTDWVLVLDADEELSVEAREALRSLLSAPEEVGGYLVKIREYLPAHMKIVWPIDIKPNRTGVARSAGSPIYLMNQLCRLFRRRADIYFTGRVHELVQPQIEKAGLRLEEANFFIDHFGHMGTQQVRNGKADFYGTLIADRLAEEPDNPLVWTYKAMAALDTEGKPLEALRHIEKAVRIEPNLVEAWIVSAKALSALERWDDVLTVLETVRSGNRYQYAESTLRGDACFALGRHEEARAAFVEAMEYNPGDQVAQAKLSYLELRLGDSAEAVEKLAQAASELPALVHILLVDAHLQAGRVAEAAEECERWCAEHKVEGALLQAAQLRAQQQNWARVEQLVRECLAIAPGSVAAHELLLMASVALGRLEDAAAAAEALTAVHAEPRTFLRAAAIHVKCGNPARAQAMLQRGAALFPYASEFRGFAGEGADALAQGAAGTPPCAEASGRWQQASV